MNKKELKEKELQATETFLNYTNQYPKDIELWIRCYEVSLAMLLTLYLWGEKRNGKRV